MSINVCIVEDDPDLRESGAAYLQEAPGFRCVGAYASAEEALEKIPGQKPDVVLQAYDVIDVPEASMFSPGRLGPTILSALTGGMASAISNTGMYLPQRVIY